MRIISCVAGCMIAWSCASSFGVAQERESDVCHIHVRSFQVPFQFSVPAKDVRDLRFHVSRDRGVTWKQIATAKPDEKSLTVETKEDGLHCFAIQVVDQLGKVNPAKLDTTTCDLKVMVDTVPPKVELKLLEARKGEIAVTWKVSDDHLDREATRLEYRHHPNGDWLRLSPNLATDKHFWTPLMMPIEVRLTARDLAGNTASVAIQVREAGGS